MLAAVIDKPGPPGVITIKHVARPRARDGWSLVRVRGFGLNRSELLTRQGHSPDVRLPRVLGIECVGEVVEATEGAPPNGTKVAAVMGGMGRAFDGGYAEYALLPNDLLIPLTTELSWDVLAALPETYLTAFGSLLALGALDALSALDGHRDDNADESDERTLLVRGGTSSVGMAAISLARGEKLRTIATTRDPAKTQRLRDAGADHVVIDRGDIAADVRAIAPAGPDFLLDLIGTNTLTQSLAIVARGGTVCLTGILSGSWTLRNFEPMAAIPSGTKLTTFHSNDLRGSAGADSLQRIVDGVAAGRYRANLDRVFRLPDIVEAHQYMEDNRAVGKVVVLT